MNLTKINTTTLRQALKLAERKEALLTELFKIEKEIEHCLMGVSTDDSFSSISQLEAEEKLPDEKKAEKTVKAKKRKHQQRGKIKEEILNALAEAGTTGIGIAELATKLHLKKSNLYTWFSNVGKKILEIERMAPGHFRLRQKVSEVAPTVATAPLPSTTPTEKVEQEKPVEQKVEPTSNPIEVTSELPQVSLPIL